MRQESRHLDFSSPQEIRPLTALRFFAALAVFVEHVPSIPGLEWLRQNPIPVGRIGVMVFFVLSGYIISLSYASKDWIGDFRGNATKFYWSRIARIYPLHWLAFLIALPLGLGSMTSRVNPDHIPWLLTLTDDLWPGFHASVQPVTVAWTLSCEILFYLLSPVVFFLLQRSARPVRASLFLLISYTAAINWVVTAYPSWNWVAYLHVPEFLLGITAYFLFKGRDLAKRSGAMIAAGLILVSGLPLLISAASPAYLHLLPAIGAALLIVAVAAVTGRTARLLSASPLVLLGHASYAMYLLHDPFLRYTRALMVRSEVAVPGISGVLMGALLLALIIAAAIASYHLVEVPARRYLRGLMAEDGGTNGHIGRPEAVSTAP